MRYYGNVRDELCRPKVQRAKVKWTLIVAVIVAAGMFVAIVSVDPFREVRQFHPVQSWGDEPLVNQSMPNDIVMFKTERCRVFKFTQDPLIVFAEVGGDSKYLQTIKDSFTAMMSTSYKGKETFEHDNGMEVMGLTVKLRSGRDADFFTIPKGKGSFTCKLVIRPLKKFEVSTIFDWLSR